MTTATIAAGLTRIQVKLYLAEAFENGNVKMAGLMMHYWDQHIQVEGFISDEEPVELFIMQSAMKELIGR